MSPTERLWFWAAWYTNGAKDAVKNDFRYICVGSLDDPEVLPPKGEFFCQSRVGWMPEIPGEFISYYSGRDDRANTL